MPSETMTTEATLEDAGNPLADLTQTVSDHAATVMQAVSNASKASMLTLTRATYTGAYFISYGIVFPVVLAAQMLPRENAAMKGLIDGGKAANEALAARAQATAEP